MRAVTGCIVLLVALVACGDDPTEPAAMPAQVMDQVAEAIGSTDSLQFQISVEGPGVELEEGVALEQLTGVYAAPDSASTEARVGVLGLNASIDIVTIGDRAWQKAPLETEYTELGPGQAPFSASELFAPDGIPAILRDGIGGVARAAEPAPALEAFPGEAYDVITGTIVGTRIDELTSGLVRSEGAAVTVFVNDGEARRIVIVEAGEGRNVWTIDAWAYGEPVSVTPPPGFE